MVGCAGCLACHCVRWAGAAHGRVAGCWCDWPLWHVQGGRVAAHRPRAQQRPTVLCPTAGGADGTILRWDVTDGQLAEGRFAGAPSRCAPPRPALPHTALAASFRTYMPAPHSVCQAPSQTASLSSTRPPHHHHRPHTLNPLGDPCGAGPPLVLRSGLDRGAAVRSLDYDAARRCVLVGTGACDVMEVTDTEQVRAAGGREGCRAGPGELRGGSVCCWRNLTGVADAGGVRHGLGRVGGGRWADHTRGGAWPWPCASCKQNILVPGHSDNVWFVATHPTRPDVAATANEKQARAEWGGGWGRVDGWVGCERAGGKGAAVAWWLTGCRLLVVRGPRVLTRRAAARLLPPCTRRSTSGTCPRAP